VESNELKQLSEEVQNIAKEVGVFIQAEVDKVQRSDIQEKVENSLVSYVDKEAEEKLVQKLKPLISDVGFITEEDTVEQQSKSIIWIIDPLDGTTNYLFGIPHYSTSIALRVNDDIQLGVITDIAKNECFHAVRGEGAFRNDKKLSLNYPLDLKESIFVTGFPYRNDYDPRGYFQIIEHWIKNSRGVRRLGSAALDLCYVACGRVSCYYESFLNIWDIAAGVLIVEEAGGRLSDFSGLERHLQSGQIVASHPMIFEEIIDVIKRELPVNN